LHPASRKKEKIIPITVKPGEQVLVETRATGEPTLEHEWTQIGKYRDSVSPAGEALFGEMKIRDEEREGITDVKYRLKTIPSIINKLRRKHLRNIRYVVGIKVIHDDYSDLLATKAFLRAEYPNSQIEDFYESPKGGANLGYRAVHYDVCVEGEPEVTGGKVTACASGTPLEIQLKTRRQAGLHKKWHLRYKEGKEMTGDNEESAERAHILDVEEAKQGRYYFKPTATSKVMPIEKLIPTENVFLPKREMATKFMIQAMIGEGAPRGPLSVKKIGDKYEILDGNQTYYAAKLMGLNELEIEEQ
jgi:ppGpp synthetase/RelA/SpoT-type nucleotidyltranferase